jgi:hypothetical protein
LPLFPRERRGGARELSVRKIKDLLRVHLVGGVNSRHQLGRAIGCSKTAASDCLRRAAVTSLTSWEVITELDETELEKRLYPSAREGGAPPSEVIFMHFQRVGIYLRPSVIHFMHE